MDPKTFDKLDPELREKYMRVMKTSTAETGEEATAPTQPTFPSNQPESTVPPQPQQSTTPWTTSGIPSAPDNPYTPTPRPQFSYQQGPSATVKIMYIVGGIVFVVIYAVIWLKVLRFF